MSTLVIRRAGAAAGIVLAATLGALTLYGAWLQLSLGTVDGWRIGSQVVAAAAIFLGAGLALLLLWKVPNRPGARPLALFLTALPLSAAPTSYVHLLAYETLHRAAGSLTLVALFVAVAALITFSEEFPQSLPQPHRWERPLRVLLFVAAALVMVTGSILDDSHSSLHGIFVLLGLFSVGLLFLGLFDALANLKRSYRLADPLGRRGLFWIWEGVLLVLLAFVFQMFMGVFLGIYESHRHAQLEGTGVAPDEYLSAWLGDLTTTVTALLLMGSLLCFAFALLYRGTLDPALVVRKTSVYGLAGILLTVVFAVTQYLAEKLLAGPVGGAGWVASILVALALAPLFRRAERRAERLLSSADADDRAADDHS